MRQVIKHRDIRLLNMIRRTDPVILDPVIPLAYGGYSSPFFFISLCNSRLEMLAWSDLS